MGSRFRTALPTGPAVARHAAAAVLLSAAAFAPACVGSRPAPLLQPGLPGQATRAIDAPTATDLSRVSYTTDDVRFMQGMIAHHSQAIEMVALVEDHTDRDDLKLLGRRIGASQADEMVMMRDWLTARGQSMAAEASAARHRQHEHHGGPGEALMPGMLSAADMSALAAARGRAFDRLFLAGMIRHHQGALLMVSQLFASPGAAQESEIFGFASDVDADQRMEIERMGALLHQLEEGDQ